MLYRKLIKFGDSSFVVSLPKEWVTRNAFKKGDLVGMEFGANSALYLLPKTNPEKPQQEITINLDEVHHLENLKTFVISAYLKNYDVIYIIGKDLPANASKIRMILQKLATVEIVEQTSKKITARVFLDPKSLSVNTLIRRLEIMAASMIEDAKESVIEGHKKEYAFQKEGDITRLTFLILKILRKSLTDADVAMSLKLEPLQILQWWNVTLWLEEVADQAKRICRYLDEDELQNKKEISKLLDDAYTHFRETMKAHHTNNKVEAVNSLQTTIRIMEESRKYLSKDAAQLDFLVMDKIRKIVCHTGNIAKDTLDR
ncbi:MAG TPA: hypothetical protein VFE88_03285 [Candidatus Nanoarchaeia archaeon]|nr:hypothetical protein [Candidatus Nanoarchaeia archaeon]